MAVLNTPFLVEQPEITPMPDRRMGSYARRHTGVRRATDWPTVLGIVGLCWIAYVALEIAGLVPAQ
jgi:hypothetical protein